MQCNWLLDHFDFLYLSSPVVYICIVRESSWLSTIKVSANRELCCQYTAIVRSSRLVLPYTRPQQDLTLTEVNKLTCVPR